MVRQRSRPGQGQSKAKRSLCRKDSSGSVSENPISKDEGQCSKMVHHLFCFVEISDDLNNYLFSGWTEAQPDTPVDETPPGQEVPEKIKKRYRKKKTKLEEAFPAYLQVSCLNYLMLDSVSFLDRVPH